MDSTLTSSRDILLYGLPLVVMLVASMFKVDELFGAPKNKAPRPRPAQGYNSVHSPMMSDPDGRPW
jgi:hypothetical protein